jgi:hypothetical protein
MLGATESLSHDSDTDNAILQTSTYFRCFPHEYYSYDWFMLSCLCMVFRSALISPDISHAKKYNPSFPVVQPCTARPLTSCMACLSLPYFAILSYKWHKFRGQLMNLKWLFRFSLKVLFERFVAFTRIQREIIINVMLIMLYFCQV